MKEIYYNCVISYKRTAKNYECI